MMGYAVLMALVYPLGTPLLYYVLLRRHKEELDKLRANQILRVKLLEEARARREYVQVEGTASLASVDAYSSKERQASSKPWHVSRTEWNLLPPATRVELMELDAYDKKQQIALPGYIKKLLKGYELRVWWFEIFECLRKLAVACVPVFFVPSGSISQLIFGLMVCFITFGMFIHYDPFEEGGDDVLAWLCQGQIFFSLLSSIALSYDEEQRAASRNLDFLLVTLWVLPLVLSAFLLSPISRALQTAIESMVAWLSTIEQKQQHPIKEVPPPQDSLPLDSVETFAKTSSILPWQDEATSVVHPRRSHLDTEDDEIEDAREPPPSARVRPRAVLDPAPLPSTRTAAAALAETLPSTPQTTLVDPPRSMTQEVGELLTERIGEMSRRVSRVFGIETTLEEGTDGTDNGTEAAGISGDRLGEEPRLVEVVLNERGSIAEPSEPIIFVPAVRVNKPRDKSRLAKLDVEA